MRHALAIERINDLDGYPPGSIGSLGQADYGGSAANLAATRDLWEAKLVQIHTAALRDGVELYPIDDDGHCSSCGLHIRTLQQMQSNGLTLADQPSYPASDNTTQNGDPTGEPPNWRGLSTSSAGGPLRRGVS